MPVSKKHIILFIVMMFCLASASSQTLKRQALFNQNWKFYKGSPTGTPYAVSFNDSTSSWSTVCVPHSASYDAPSYAAENSHYRNNSWYRKTFTCPANAEKVFIHFEGAMQTTTVFVNGDSVGIHDNSGYTGFFFDISSKVQRGRSNIIAVHLYVKYATEIPPGGLGYSSPDFFLFSGLYRNVWLVFKDSVYVPLRGQQITTTGTVAGPTVHAITNVKNDAADAKNATVAITLRDATGASVVTKSSNATIAANSASTFDLTTDVIASPSLWSPSSPYLYSLQTLVSVDGKVVDSIIEPVGLRFYSWSTGTPGGLSINGTLTEIKGVCMAQFMGWIENAVPDSRFATQVKMIKDMGINSIRCAHYPRADAFYRACDSLGMLLYVEVPTWGVDGGFDTNTAFWKRIYSCDSEMVLDGYNHPSIYVWGLFNEPSETTLDDNFTIENNIIHALDPVAGSGRVTAIANYQGLSSKYGGDIMCVNYSYDYTTSLPLLNTEAYGDASDASLFGSWTRLYIRGSSMEMDITSTGETAHEDSCLQTYYWKTTDKLAGSHFWCFMDYNSNRNSTGYQGIVDRLWLPKNIYFRFRKSLTGVATDYWQKGTPTKIDLAADITSLKADGSDISLITATLRDDNGKCMHTDCNIAFTISPATAGTLFPDTGSTYGTSVTVPVRGGRTGVLLRTTTTPGSITVTATPGNSLAAASMTLQSVTATESYYEGDVPVVKKLVNSAVKTDLKLRTRYSGNNIIITSPFAEEKTLHIVNCRGETVASYRLKKGGFLVIDRRTTGEGIYYAVCNDAGRRIFAKIN
ncbi:MAG TPA: hypothetical protein DCO75_09870, partial [Fibrobacteres bacterium]|nr:hypothetical protein [Fibrobacterota bacterium]